MNPRSLALVAIGGAVGAVARWSLTTTFTWVDDLLLGTLIANLVGAFLLGLLLEASGGSSNDRRSDDLRLLLGTGALGGFTTYSTFALETRQLLAESAAQAIAYVAATLIGGIALAAAGVVTARRVRGAR